MMIYLCFCKNDIFVNTLNFKKIVAFTVTGAPVAQWVKRWPTDLADQVQASLKVKSSQP